MINFVVKPKETDVCSIMVAIVVNYKALKHLLELQKFKIAINVTKLFFCTIDYSMISYS